jgi:hypothetical protein
VAIIVPEPGRNFCHENRHDAKEPQAYKMNLSLAFNREMSGKISCGVPVAAGIVSVFL